MFVKVLLLLTLQGACSFDFQIEPRKITLRPGQRATILCRANVTLTRCRFLLPGNVIADLSRGDTTPDNAEYGYYGTGLENGQCGITLISPESGFNSIACQGRTEREGWKRDAMFLRVTNMETLPWELDRHHIVALPGTNVNFVCKSQYSLTDCRIGFMNEDRWISFTRGASTPATSEYRYFGTGLENGQCGITLFNVKEELSGDVRCVGISGTRWAGDFTTLVVAKTPNQPDLQISSTNLLDGGTLVATCTVSNGRPAATISWYIDGKLVTDGITDNSPSDAWFDYQVQTKMEKLTKRVTWRDHGKDIKCVANHVALFDYLNQETKHIDVKFKPQPTQRTIKQAGLVVGQRGLIKFEILANPKPLLTWSFSDMIIEDDDMGATGRFRALPAVSKGHGKWEAQLEISDVTENDFGVMFAAKAKNQAGSFTYRVSLEGNTHFTPPPTVKPVEVRPTPSSQQGDCGRPLISVQLVIRGNQTQEGNWPWIAAMFVRKTRKAGLEFQCGGTLINKKHVVTAAHCVKAEGKAISPTDILIYLGKHNLNDWVAPNAQTKQVGVIHIYPEYMGTNTGGDLAVLEFTNPAQFTSYVRPICLWNRDAQLSSVVGQYGFLAGWGRMNPEEDSVSDVPQMSKSPIVSHEECIRSNTDFAHFTSVKTFCAGLRDGSGPCNGDSGSGFFMPYNSNGQKRWYLRGLVSFSLADSSTGYSCDLKNYVVYTDVAMFSTWLAQFTK